MQFDELQGLFGVQNASLDMLRELYVELGEASYWLKLESCPVEEDKQPGRRRMNGGMNVFPQFGENALICGFVGGVASAVGPSRQRLQK